jgi:hypothetical protein
MAFSDREYEVYAILGGPTASPPWVHATWGEVYVALDPLIQAARDRSAVRSTQTGPKPGSSKQRTISFGRIGWNEQSAKKWTHREDGQLASGDPAYFMTSEVWAPSWTACERERLAPDAYFAIRNESDFAARAKESKAVNFSSTCILASASDLGPESIAQARRSAEAIATVLQAAARGYCVRPWGRRIEGSGSYTDAINDLFIIGLFKPGPRDTEPVSLAMFKDTWASF